MHSSIIIIVTKLDFCNNQMSIMIILSETIKIMQVVSVAVELCNARVINDMVVL